ncbi:MAG TPA: FAD-binding oxidoreductase [Candidatus Nanoarchaeia archaeon]|nr:FAD-binding oxidoreductase [Candidatus Nanoarchaeia archaeon]
MERIPPKSYQAVVKIVVDETPSVYTLHLKLPEPMRFYPGQYVMVRYLKDGKRINKPYSIASAPIDLRHLDLCIKRVDGGHCSNYLYHQKAGDTVEVFGPMGNFVLNEQSEKPVLFIAGGSGIGPIRAMIHYLIATGSQREFWLFFGNRNSEEIIYHQEFLRLAEQNPRFKYHPVLSRQDWTGERGYVQDVMQRYIQEFTEFEAYICGLPDLVNTNRELLIAKGIAPRNVHHEVYV